VTKEATVDAQELLSQARDAMTARRVFGDPIERNGTLILPVASVMGGAGGGTGRMARPAGSITEEGAAGEGEAHPDEGSGYGFGMMAKPLGVYVVRGEEVTWEPAVDRNRQLFLAALVAIFSVFAVRSVLLAIAHR
jgi:uncharacterized spore protein YtfJ